MLPNYARPHPDVWEKNKIEEVRVSNVSKAIKKMDDAIFYSTSWAMRALSLRSSWTTWYERKKQNEDMWLYIRVQTVHQFLDSHHKPCTRAPGLTPVSHSWIMMDRELRSRPVFRRLEISYIAGKNKGWGKVGKWTIKLRLGAAGKVRGGGYLRNSRWSPSVWHDGSKVWKLRCADLKNGHLTVVLFLSEVLRQII